MRGIGVWYDEWETNVGDSFRRKIFDEGIGESDYAIVALSKASLQSEWVQREIDASFALAATEVQRRPYRKSRIGPSCHEACCFGVTVYSARNVTSL